MIKDEDIKIEDITPKAIGQVAGSPARRIRITHIDSKISVEVENKSQYKAVKIAKEMLQYGLLELGYE